VDEKQINVDVQGERLDILLNAVAKRCGVGITRIGSTWFVGALHKNDRAVLVRKVAGIEISELQEVVDSLLSDYGRAKILSDGVVVVIDYSESLERISVAMDDLEKQEPGTWVVQVILERRKNSSSSKFGIDGSQTFEAAVVMGDGASDTDIAGGLRLRIEAERDSSDFETWASPLFLVVDGGKARMHSGGRVPYKTTTREEDSGDETDEWQFLESGLTVDVALREVNKERARVMVDIEMRDVEAADGESPPAHEEETLTSGAVVNSGGVYLLGQLEKRKRGRSSSGLLGMVRSRQRSNGVFLVYFRAFRLSGPSADPDGGHEEPEK
jgi:type II secretory pathway component GspD/PulD (secretin)